MIMGPGTNGCSDRITYAGPDTARECDTAVVSACLEPGVYWLYACPKASSVSFREYFAYVRCVPCTPPEPPEPEFDMGDLATCNYPTLVNNPAHKISGIAWLGDAVTAETSPYTNNQDPADDGVDFITVTWTPCRIQQLTVKITAGEHYQAYADSGNHLYLNAWKDGNLDGDFCDTLCRGVAPEWIIQDEIVVPSAEPQLFEVLDPGREDTTHYDGIFRFRLTSRRVGALGFGLISPNSCGNMTCGTFDVDYLGEVEDYIVDDLQLAVELGSFSAIAGDGSVTLRWNTLAEQNNDRFEIIRNGSLVARVNGLGNSPSGHAYQWVDENVEPSAVYNYSLYSVDLGGIRNMLATASATPVSTSATVTEYTLMQNYPNPFNPTTSISFNLLESGTTILTVYNPMGQLVATLVNGQLNAGSHTVTFDAANLPSGVYLYRLESGSYSAVKKMLLMK
ncbi:T9SS C-terminal target domain-containing protein [candidate division KSB1 bacterium]|nr:MAG: T9SS C-terminal target domain-containing protein [candidate division KSB1 bacterium]